MNEFMLDISKETLYRNLARELALRDSHLEWGVTSFLEQHSCFPEYMRREETAYNEEFKYFDLDNIRILGMKQPQNVVELDKPFRLSGLILTRTVTDILTRILSGEVISIKFIDGRNMKVKKEAEDIVFYVNLEKVFAISDLKELQRFIGKICPTIIRYGSKPAVGPVVYVVEQKGNV